MVWKILKNQVYRFKSIIKYNLWLKSLAEISGKVSFGIEAAQLIFHFWLEIADKWFDFFKSFIQEHDMENSENHHHLLWKNHEFNSMGENGQFVRISIINSTFSQFFFLQERDMENFKNHLLWKNHKFNSSNDKRPICYSSELWNNR